MKTPSNIPHYFFGKGIFFLVVLLFCSFYAKASIETSTNSLTGTSVVKFASVTAVDNKYSFISTYPSSWRDTFKIASAVGRVRVGFDHSSLSYVSTAYDYTFYLKIEYKDSSLATTTTLYKQLTAQYDPNASGTYQDAELYEVNTIGVVWLKVTVDSIHDNSGTGSFVLAAPSNMFVEASTVVERYYVMNYSAVPASSVLSYDAPHTTGITDSNEVQVYWNYIAGAEQYQLEWTYVNDYDSIGGTLITDSLHYDFTHNSTRITTTAQHFNIPLIFDKGWLLVRLRAVSKAYDSGSGEWKYVYGKWTSDGVGSVNTVNNYISGHSYHITTPHERSKNWQYVGTFAEEGKNKAVVSYYDGTLRNRQTVTKTSTDKKVLVGETFYDFQGRAAITALPTPVEGVDQELRYYEGYNLVDSASIDKGYSRYDFDVDVSACTTPTIGMKTSIGASNYYSTSNTETDFAQAYLPDAKKFPFAQVEYMPDNTGRIRQQGGVGPDHQLASNHQTQYYYGQPFQEELDRLFGTDAGYKKHYNKTLTVDANGQASVTYLDQEGRTVATALAGVNPYNLAALTDASGDTLYNTAMTVLTVDLLAKDTATATDTDHDDNILSTDGTKLSLNTQLTVPFAQTYSFDYSLTGAQYSPGCLPMGTCYQCVYDMTIEVRNQCGDTMGPRVRKKVGSFNTSCAAGNATFTSSPGALDMYLPVGSYTVTKTLTINDSALDLYWQDYLAQTTCTRTLQSFVDSAEARIDSSGCHLNNTDDVGYISQCEASYLMMLSDVSPDGQYAEYLVQGSPAPSQYPLSLMNDGGNYLPLPNSDWRHPIINGSADHYYEADGTTVSRIPLITIDASTYTFNPAVENTSGAHSNLSLVNGVWTIEPQFLANVSDFIAFWENSWATSLVEYHPEYCYYNWCKGDLVGHGSGVDTLSSDEYDSLLLSTSSYTAALAAGYLDPLGNANASPNQSNCKDPFFRSLGLGHAHYNNGSLPDACEYTSDFQGSTINIWKMAAVANACGTVYGDATDVDNCLIAKLGSLPTDQRDYIYNDSTWHTFRALYLSIKQHFQALQADSSAKVCGEYNGCIGNDDYDPAAAGMFTGVSIFSWPYYTDPSPCGLYSGMYSGKIQRFPNAENLVDNMSAAWAGNPGPVLDSAVSQGNYDFYLQTGQCPSAFALQELFNALNNDGNLMGSSLPLQPYPQFTQTFYDVITGHPSSYDPVDWTGSGSGATLTIHFNASTQPCKNDVTLDFQAGSSFSWSGLGSSFSILNFSQLTSTGSGSFTIVATIDDDMISSTPPVNEILTGFAGCFDVTCSFPEKCEANTQAHEIYNLMNILAANSDLYNTGGVNISTGSYGAYFNGTQLRSILGTGPWYWKETGASSNVFEISNGISSHPKLIVRIPSLPVSGVTSFNTLVINNPDTTATVNAYDGSDNSVVFDLDWDHSVGGFVSVTSLDLGVCGAATPTVCQGDDYQRRTDLETLLSKLGASGNLASGTAFDLYNYSYFTPLLAATFGPTSYNWNDTIIGDSLMAVIVNDTTNDTTCNVSLIFNSTPSGGHSWSTVKRITNLVADETSMINGVAYTFKAVAWFSDSTNMAITGTSCWGIRNCSVCMSSAGNVFQNFDNFDSLSPGFTTTRTYTSSCTGGTAKYTVTKSESVLCSDPTLVGEDHTQPGNGQYYYTEYSSLPNQTLWSTTTSVTAFTSYNFSVWYMNNWLDTAQHNVTLELWANSVLVASTVVADSAPGVWQRLQGVWNGIKIGGSITIEVKTSGSGTVNTHLGLDDIGFYTEGCGPQFVLTLNDTVNHVPYCDSCRQNTVNIAVANGNAQYQQYMDSVQANFRAAYIKHCMSSAVEVFNVSDTMREYHYTLYYYDQGGNLTRTIPPAGVVPVNLTTYGQAIKHARAYRTDHPDSPKYFFTAHTLATTYTYNTLNQLVQQVTPDGDTTRFWYDKLGRIVASQNAKQKAYSTPRYSYTIYDAQGRIAEVGELATSNDLRTASFATQQAWLNDYNYPDLLDGAAVSSSNYRFQVTKTYYDEIKFSSAAARFSNATQENLRKRVASAAVYEYYQGTDANYNSASHYSYDLHGNVQEMVQENSDLRDLDDVANNIYQSFKNFKYEYDLVSGKVNELLYNQEFADEYFYKYEYDDDNRVTAAYTSTDGRQWDRDAKYFYYKHGPLARTEIGQDKVQGEDYAYTLHGWIKGVNSNKLATINDMGLDADNFFTVNLNRYVGADQFGYSLTYYDTTGHTDYTQIAGQSWLASQSGASLQTDAFNLWNGNIKNMVTSIEAFMPNGRPQGRDFKYDQLNRIVGAQADTNFVTASNSWGTTGGTTKWREKFTYDENGNITKLVRHGKVLTPMDSLNYHYASGTNQLTYVDDVVSSGNYGDDVDDQSSGNYSYDKIGNLVSDVAEEIDTINWNVYGKIESVIRKSTSSKSDMVFHYDASGNRICKLVKPRGGSGVLSQDHWTYTYYQRDASGNVIATYDRKFTAVVSGNSTETFSQKENDLYGSSRVGIRNNSQQLSSLTIAVSGTGTGGNFITTFTGAATGSVLATNRFTHKLGEKLYELVNHLGNVLVTVSDMRTANHASTTVTGWNAVVESATDYYAFGSPMEGRSFSSTSYRYGMNGQEKDDELTGNNGTIYTADYWEYDARLGRRWNTDPVVKEWESPYATFENNPIQIADVNGDEGEDPNDDSSNGPEVTSAMTDQGTTLDLGQNIVQMEWEYSPSTPEPSTTTTTEESYTYTQTTSYTSMQNEHANKTFYNVVPGSTVNFNTFSPMGDDLTFTDATTGTVLYATNGFAGSPGTGIPAVGSFIVPDGTTAITVTSKPCPKLGPKQKNLGSVFNVTVVQSAVIVFTEEDVKNQSGGTDVFYNWYIPATSANQIKEDANKSIDNTAQNANPPGGPVAPSGLYAAYLAAGGKVPDLFLPSHSRVKQ